MYPRDGVLVEAARFRHREALRLFMERVATLLGPYRRPGGRTCTKAWKKYGRCFMICGAFGFSLKFCYGKDDDTLPAIGCSSGHTHDYSLQESKGRSVVGLSRSERMARVKGKDTSPERILRSALWEAGLRYRLNHKAPAGRPNIVFPGSKVAVSVDGCFWHGCTAHYSRPRSREEFWSQKLAANTERDSRLTLRLESFGWIMVRVREHEVFSKLDEVVEVIRQATQGLPPSQDRDWRVVRVVPVPEEGEDWERQELRLLRDWDVVRYEVGPRKTGRDKGSPKAVRAANQRSRDRKSSKPEKRLG